MYTSILIPKKDKNKHYNTTVNKQITAKAKQNTQKTETPPPPKKTKTTPHITMEHAIKKSR